MFGKFPLIGRLRWRPCCLGGGLVLTLVIFFLAWSYATFPGDREALEQFQGNQSGWLDTAASGVTRLGWAPVSTALMVLTVVGLMVMRRWADSLVVAAGAWTAKLLPDLANLAVPERQVLASMRRRDRSQGRTCGRTCFLLPP